MFAGGDYARAIELFDEAYVARDSASAIATARCSRSRERAARTSRLGEIDEGLALLDEATASAMCGDLRAHSAGLVYCITISSCQDLGDYRRAAEWTEAANRLCDKLDVTGFPGACRIHRAEVLRLRGDWSAAEAQALAACEELHDFDRSITAFGHYEIGEIRRRRGDFAGAEEAYGISNELGPRAPARARAPPARRGQGRRRTRRDHAVAAGCHRIRSSGSGGSRRRSRSPSPRETSRRRAPRRTRSSRSSTRTRSASAARRRSTRPCTSHAARSRSPRRTGRARSHRFRHARDEWQGVGAPYETARARVLLGSAYTRSGDEHAGVGRARGRARDLRAPRGRARRGACKELLGRVEARRTFLFTDIVDSTKLLETLGDDKWKRLLARHDELVRECISQAGGEVVKQTGDGFFASFENPEGRDRRGGRDPARARGRDRRAGRPDRRPFGRRVPHGRGLERLRRPGRPRRVTDRRGRHGGRDPRQRRDARRPRARRSARASERSETLKGVAEPVDVVSIEWR